MKIRTQDTPMLPVVPETLTAWEKRKEDILANLRFASSIDLLKHDAPLNAQVFDAVEYDNFVVEKVIFQSLPGYYVTGNLYHPKDTSKKYPAVLQPHGHWENGRREVVDLARIPQRCANFAMRGMVAFIYDMVGYNDSVQVAHQVNHPENAKWNFGRFSLQLNNSIKAVDFVASLPYVDADRIGCTGCSGGGTQTYFLTALDPRVKVAAPINMACSYMQGGCICENTPYLRTDYNNIDYTMTIAPRPLFLSGSDGDWTVHTPEVEFPAVKALYALYGKEEDFSCFYQSAPHCYNLPTRERVYRFFCRHFGIEDSFDGEVDFEIDTQSLLIGDWTDRVPKEGYIDSEDKLVSMVSGIIRANLAKLSRDEKAELVCRVFDLSKRCELDIPYTSSLSFCHAEDRFVLDKCPENVCKDITEYLYTYNRAQDAERVNALVHLMRDNPNTTFVAEGKSAALCQMAARIAGHSLLSLTNCDDTDIDIPGLGLLD